METSPPTSDGSASYEILLSMEEARLLSALPGVRVKGMATDGCGIHVQFEDRTFVFRPEEVAAPDEAHPDACITRIGVEPHHHQEMPPHRLVEDGGIIQEVSIATTVISFSVPVEIPPTDYLRNMGMLKQTGYGPIYWLPSDTKWIQEAAQSRMAFSRVHIGVRLQTDQRQILISTDGAGYFVHTILDDLGRENLQGLDGHDDLVNAASYVQSHER